MPLHLILVVGPIRLQLENHNVRRPCGDSLNIFAVPRPAKKDQEIAVRNATALARVAVVIADRRLIHLDC